MTSLGASLGPIAASLRPQAWDASLEEGVSVCSHDSVKWGHPLADDGLDQLRKDGFVSVGVTAKPRLEPMRMHESPNRKGAVSELHGRK
jgi:hypothetical protein